MHFNLLQTAFYKLLSTSVCKEISIGQLRNQPVRGAGYEPSTLLEEPIDLFLLSTTQCIANAGFL